MHFKLLLHARHHPLWLYLCLCSMSSVPTIMMAPALMLSRQPLNVNETVKCGGPGQKEKKKPHQDINFVPLSRSSIKNEESFGDSKVWMEVKISIWTGNIFLRAAD